MNHIHDQRILISGRRGGNWLQRALFIAVGAVVAVAAFFFLAVALAAGAFIALALGIRWWWMLRHIRARAKASQAIDGEYTVVESQRTERRPLDR
jgi:hypothetical protein